MSEEDPRFAASYRALSNVSVVQLLEIAGRDAQGMTAEGWRAIEHIRTLGAAVGLSMDVIAAFCRKTHRDISKHSGQAGTAGRRPAQEANENPFWQLANETWNTEADERSSAEPSPDSFAKPDTITFRRDEIEEQAAVLNGLMASVAERDTEIISLRSQIEDLASQLRVADTVLDTVGKCRRGEASRENELQAVNEECGKAVHALRAELAAANAKIGELEEDLRRHAPEYYSTERFRKELPWFWNLGRLYGHWAYFLRRKIEADPECDLSKKALQQIKFSREKDFRATCVLIGTQGGHTVTLLHELFGFPAEDTIDIWTQEFRAEKGITENVLDGSPGKLVTLRRVFYPGVVGKIPLTFVLDGTFLKMAFTVSSKADAPQLPTDTTEIPLTAEERALPLHRRRISWKWRSAFSYILEQMAAQMKHFESV
jgi:hypothetical protein